MKFNLTYIAGANSPVHKITRDEAKRYYQLGAPYLATARDMYNIAKKWSEFVPRVHDEHPHLLAEMFAYVIASADLNLKHQLLDSFMISNPTSPDEGWSFIDKIPLEKTCLVGSHLEDENYLVKNGLKKYILPNVLHFCQRVGVGSWIWAKMRFPSEFFTCSSPLLSIPPIDIATKYNYFDIPKASLHDTENKGRLQYSKVEVGRNAFTLCAMVHAMNEASIFYKENFCNGVQGTRLDKSMELKDVYWKDSNRAYVPEIERIVKVDEGKSEVGRKLNGGTHDAEAKNEEPNSEKGESRYHIIFSTDCSGEFD